MKTNNCSLIIVVFFLLVCNALAEEQGIAEEQGQAELLEFRKNGLNENHYQKAQYLNLDLENYKSYCSNRSNKIKGAVMMGIGGGLLAEGLICILLGAIYEAPVNDPYGYNNNDEVEDVAKKVYMITGGISGAVGLGLLIGGGVKRSNVKDVFRKDGTKISLIPSIDFLNNKYEAVLSYSF